MGNVNIFLIRHGESVDNVAGLLAGVRDSPLTSHGVTQARRLGTALGNSTKLSWLFASNLQRAVQTAEAVREAQKDDALEVAQVPDLREKDFGADEGRRWGERAVPADDAESKQAMRVRALRFVDEHLTPIVASAADADDAINIAVVSHGMFLATLLYALRSVECVPLAQITPGGDDLVRWSNTGYARLELTPVSSAGSLTGSRWHHWRITVKGVNNTEHLVGLKKTRGGIGSAQFDTKQKTLTSFFAASGGTSSKKRKADDQLEK